MATVPPNQRAGLIHITIDGITVDAKGDFTYNLGSPKREAIKGADRVHGRKEEVQVPFIKGQITDRAGLDVKALTNISSSTIVLVNGAGKTVIFREAWFAGDGDVSTSEGAIDVEFQAMSADEV